MRISFDLSAFRLSMVCACFVVSAAIAGAQEQPTPTANITELERQTIGGLAAIVNDYPISQADVIERARLTIMTLGSRPTPEQQQQILVQSLEQLIDEQLQIAEAGSYDLIVEDARVNRELEQVSSQMNLTASDFESQLRERGINPASLREQLRAEIAWREIIQGLYGSGIRISKNRIEAEKRSIHDKISQKSYNLSEIFLFTGGDAVVQEEAMTAARTLVEQIKQGTSFALVAERLSSSPTAATGGSKGWVALDTLPPEVADAVSVATERGLLEPIMASDGVYIILLDGVSVPDETQVVFDFAQIVEKENNRPALDLFLTSAQSCDALREEVDANDNIQAFWANDIALSGLSETMQDRLTGLQVGGISEAFESQSGLAKIYVCDRREDLSGLPDDEAIEGSLRQRELAMIADRTLRNLRREATIIRR